MLNDLNNLDRGKLCDELESYGVVTDASWTTKNLYEKLVKLKGIENYKHRLGGYDGK